MTEHEHDGQYHHDPGEGETTYPVQEGEQRGPHRKGELDPHEPLNTPLTDLPPTVAGQAPRSEGMGGKPHARGERVSSTKLPPEDD